MLSSTRRVCAAMSPSTSCPVAGSSGTWPDTNSSCPARTAGEYGPIAFGASGLETACFIAALLGGLDDLVRAQAAGADPHPLDAAVDRSPGPSGGSARTAARSRCARGCAAGRRPGSFRTISHRLAMNSSQLSITAFTVTPKALRTNAKYSRPSTGLSSVSGPAGPGRRASGVVITRRNRSRNARRLA